jgi:DNA-binding CsgD family transcriptional regulator/GAF domain-containing protein
MICLSTAVLRRAHRFLLEIHAAGEVDALRELIPEGLSGLISSDRMSLNDVETDLGRRNVIPKPVPAWWSRYGDVYARHLTDHPLWSKMGTRGLSRVISLSDRCYADTWTGTTLCNEYFIPLEIKHQLSAVIYTEGTYLMGIAINRSRRDFSPQDRALLDLVCPHATQAWRNALTLAALRQQAERPGELPPASHAVVVLDTDSGTIRSLSPRAALIVRKHFGTDSGGNNRLPDEIGRWLQAQEARLGSAAEIGSSALLPLVTRSAGGQMTARLVQRTAAETIVLVEERVAARAEVRCGAAQLTPRENDILYWLREGKRNSEIGVILGISGRTVEKHLEHVFEKLGVEARTAAVRAALELTETCPALRSG